MDTETPTRVVLTSFDKTLYASLPVRCTYSVIVILKYSHLFQNSSRSSENNKKDMSYDTSPQLQFIQEPASPKSVHPSLIWFHVFYLGSKLSRYTFGMPEYTGGSVCGLRHLGVLLMASYTFRQLYGGYGPETAFQHGYQARCPCCTLALRVRR